MIQGTDVTVVAVVIAVEMARSIVIAKARVPIQNPRLSVGVPVLEKLPRAATYNFDPARSLPAGITGTLPSVVTFCFVVKVANVALAAMGNGPTGSAR
jgi:hypothetical protein